MDKEIKQIVDYKQAGIKTNMDRKEEGIFISGACRDATLVTTTFYPEIAKEKDVDLRVKAIRKAWEEWQQYFYDQMKSKMPIAPVCSTCNTEMKTSQYGNLYCPSCIRRKDQPAPLEPHQQAFANNLK